MAKDSKANKASSKSSNKCDIPGCEKSNNDPCWIGNCLHGKVRTTAESAIAHLFNTYQEDLIQLVNKSLYKPSYMQAEDVVQEVYYVLQRDKKKVDPERCLLPFTRTITFRTSISLGRKLKVRRKYMSSSDELELDVPEEVNEEDNRLHELAIEHCMGLIDEVLKNVSHRKKEAWRLKWMEGYTLREIAEHFNRNIDTVRKDWIYDVEKRIRSNPEIGATVKSIMN